MSGKHEYDNTDVEGIVEFSKFIEQAMCDIVHHSTWSAETLIALILDKVTQSFLEGERVTVRGKRGSFKVLEHEPSGCYTLQPASGGPPIAGVESTEMIRHQESQVHLLTPQSIAAWLDFSADVRDIEDDQDAECLWRMKKAYRDLYNLESDLPDKFVGRVKFPVEHNDGSEQETYEPSDEDDQEEEEEEEEGEEYEDEEEEELEIDQTFGEEDMALGTRRRKPQRSFGKEVNVDEESDDRLQVLHTLQFDGLPLKNSVLYFLLETMDEAEKRISDNEDKMALFNALKDVGPEGLYLDEIIESMKDAGCILPDEVSEAQEYVCSVYNSDAAFFKRLETKICLTAVIGKVFARKFVEIFEKCADESLPQPDKGRRASPESKIEARQIESLRRLSDQYNRNVQSYQLKCPKCHKFISSGKSKLASRKCKTCPREYHVKCLDKSEVARDRSVWSCEKCIDTAQAGLRKILDLEDKKEQIMERNRRLAEEKQRKKISKSRSKPQKASKEIKRVSKRSLSDAQVLEEETKMIDKIKRRIKELKESAEGTSNSDLSLQQEELKKAQEELARIQNEIKGPPKEYPLLFKSSNTFAVFNEASGVSEFLSLYGDICELEEIFDTPELLLSTRWPLDLSNSLVPLYSQLILCCLLEQLNRDPPMKSRARKWTRILTNATWPEVLRRYIKCTRVPTEKEVEDGIYEPIADLQCESRGLYSDDFEKLKKEADEFLNSKGWWEMPVELQLSLLHALCYDIAQGYTLKMDMGNKIQDCARISTDFGKLLQQVKRIKKEKQQEDKRKLADAMAENGSDDEDDNDEDDDLEDEIALQVGEKEEKKEKELALRSFRTDCLGIDRYGRRYWWLRGSRGAIVVEDDHGKHAGIIKSTADLDNIMKHLIRKGPREGNLLRTMKRYYKRLCASLSEEGLETSLVFENIERPVPTDGRQKIKSLDELGSQMMLDTLSEAKMKLDEILSDIVTSEIQLAADLKGYRKTLRSLETSPEVCTFMLQLESILCTAGEGLPPYASNDNMIKFLGEEDASKLPAVVYVQREYEREERADAMNQGSAEENDQGDENEMGTSEGEVDHVTALIQENPLFKALKPFIVQPSPVTCDDDYDCSEAEHTYLREKRMRKPARLWRSGRERAVWLKGLLQAAEAPRAVGSTKVTYSAYILGDRVNLLIERCQALEKEIARWEAEEQERQKAEILLEKEKSLQTKEPRERPMMIRTGKAKTEGGVKVVLKLIGREPFPQGRNATTAMDIMAPEEDVAKCRWGYQCSVCLLAGDLICCEHADGCAVSVHEDCSGQGFPDGKWICPNHDESNLKTRVRKRSEQNMTGDSQRNGRKSLAEPDPLADMMTSDEDDDNPKASGPSKKAKASDSATITEETTQDDDSDYV